MPHQGKKRHKPIMIAHPRWTPRRAGAGIGRHLCPACPQSFTTDEGYKEHYKLAHRNRTAY